MLGSRSIGPRLARLAGIALLASGCPTVGDGEPGEETRTLAQPIRELELFDGVHVDITIDPTAPEGASLTVRGDSNLLERVVTEVHSTDVLGIGMRATVESRPTLTPEVAMTTAMLDRVYVGDASELIIRELIGGTMTVRGSDSATLRIAGTTTALDVDLNADASLTLEGLSLSATLVTADDATIDAGALTLTDVDLTHTSGGDVQLCASGSIRGELSGSGSLILLCAPGSIELEVSGEGTVQGP